MNVFSNYLAEIINLTHRERMRDILEWTIKTFPQLNGRIAWNKPMFTFHGTFIIGYSISTKHVGVMPEEYTLTKFTPAIEAVGYTHGTRLFRLPFNEPVDYGLLKQIIEFNLEDKKDTQTFWR